MPRKPTWKRMPTKAIRIPAEDCELFLSISAIIDTARDANEAMTGAIAIVQNHFGIFASDSKQTTSNCTNQVPIVQNEPLEIFEYWRTELGHPLAKFTNERRQKIIARLADGYSIEQIKSAVDGCHKSDYHMGANDGGKRYDDIVLICRNGSKLEQFISYLEAKPHVKESVTTRRLREIGQQRQDAEDRGYNNQSTALRLITRT